MKKQIVIIVFILVFSGTTSLLSNPIAEIFISEIYFDSGEWTIELRNDWGEDFTGWYIKSSTDSAYLKEDINFSQEYFTITKDSMQSELFINRMGDVLTLYNDDGYIVQRLKFGFDDDAYILPTQFGQSICSKWNQTGSIIYYLDQTPTLGIANDTLNANGCLEGIVTDTLGNPIEGVKVIYNIVYSDTLFVPTDSAGYFSFEYLAMLKRIFFLKPNYQTYILRSQIIPESTATLQPVLLSKVVTDIKEIEASLPGTFELNQNYPNPFNPSTRIQFTIPVNVISTEGRNLGDFSSSSTSRNDNSIVLLKVYDILGNEITTLVNEQKPPGTYEVEFNGEGLTSGIYFYKLSVGKYSETKKMLLMK